MFWVGSPGGCRFLSGVRKSGREGQVRREGDRFHFHHFIIHFQGLHQSGSFTTLKPVFHQLLHRQRGGWKQKPGEWGYVKEEEEQNVKTAGRRPERPQAGGAGVLSSARRVESLQERMAVSSFHR